MTKQKPTDPNSAVDALQARVQAASDALADALAAGDDTTAERKELDDARAALQAHQGTVAASERERQAAQAAEADQAAVVAVAKATSAVSAAVERVQLPEGVEAPAPAEHPVVAGAAAEVARIELEIQRGESGRQKAKAEVDALVKRADAKRVEAGAIRSRRLAGHQEGDDAARLHLLEADAADLADLAQVARERLHVIEQPLDSLRQRLAEAGKKLAAARVEAELHGQADRLRIIEAALISGWRELRRSAMERGHSNVPSFFIANPDLRRVSYGQDV